MARPCVSLVCALLLAASAHAQSALAPWFDADGFYNKPNADLTRVTNDMVTCRAEAARLKVVRNTSTQVGTASGFNADGSYNPVVSGAATGIASIMFAIQDANYNGGIEQIEFRDCAIALGYRHYRLSERDRARFDAEPDRGFSALVSGATPHDGRLNEGEVERNYYSAELVARSYENAAPRPVATAIDPLDIEPAGDEGAPEPSPAPSQPTPAVVSRGVIARIGVNEIVAPQTGMAIVVASASQLSGSMQMPMAGDTFRFKRVTPEGSFADLAQPSASFSLRSHFNPERRRDPTLRGEFRAPRYSTYQIPVGRYVLSDLGTLNACLGTLTFDVADGDVVYLGNFVLRPPSIPLSPLFNPLANINSGFDNRLRADLRVGIGDDLEAARQALQADAEAKERLTRVSYQNGYRIPCAGQYVGRVANPAWSEFGQLQATAFNDALAAAVAAAR